LETLDVRGNYLSQLPSSIDACARLEHVDIRDNRFTRLPYFDTRSLHTLLADSNQIGLIEDDIYR
jgi:Leucine-rich repeat (LRR) protein